MMFLLPSMGQPRTFGGSQYEMSEKKLVLSAVYELLLLQNWRIWMLVLFFPGCLVLSQIWAVGGCLMLQYSY